MDAYKVVILGATGSLGSAIIQELIKSSKCQHITAFVRSAKLPHHKKLSQHVISMDNFGQADSLIEGHNVAISSIGVAHPHKASITELEKVDWSYPATFARTCKQLGIEHFHNVSTIGAHRKSKVPFLRVKGQLEHTIGVQKFARVCHYRPSVLISKDKEAHTADSFIERYYPHVARFLPAAWRPMPVEDFAAAIKLSIERDADGLEYIHHDDAYDLLNGEDHSTIENY